MNTVNELDSTFRTVPTVVVRRTMRAIVHRQYGSPALLALGEVDRPVPGDDDVLVRVHAASVNIGDHHVVTGRPYMIRLSPFGGLPRPKNRVLGATMAGRVEAVGANVTTVRPGDEVYGQARSGAFAEYLAVPANMIALKPSNLSFEEAAAAPWVPDVNYSGEQAESPCTVPFDARRPARAPPRAPATPPAWASAR